MIKFYQELHFLQLHSVLFLLYGMLDMRKGQVIGGLLVKAFLVALLSNNILNFVVLNVIQQHIHLMSNSYGSSVQI